MSPKSWIKATLVLIAIASVLQIAGVVSPAWIYLHKNSLTVAVGLFYRTGCAASSGALCTDPDWPDVPFDYGSADTFDRTHWTAIIWLETIAAVGAVMLTLVMIVYATKYRSWENMSTVNFGMVVLSIFTWLPIAAGLIVFAVFHGLVITRSPEISGESFPWSALACFIAGILFVIATFLIRLKCNFRKYLKNAIPTSADSKMALNPSTKNQLMTRYFAPTPYKEDRRQVLQPVAYTDNTRLLANGSAVGMLEHNGVGTRGFKAIEGTNSPISVDIKEDVHYVYTPVIETRNLAVGTVVGPSTASPREYVEVNDRATTQNVENNYGRRIIERSYVTRTGNETAARNAMDRDYSDQGQLQALEERTYVSRQGNFSAAENAVDRAYTHRAQMEEMDMRRKGEFRQQMQQWDTLQAEAAARRQSSENRVVATNVADSESDTIFYTGREDHGRQKIITREYVQASRPVSPPHEQIVRELSVIQTEDKAGQGKSVYRLPAEHMGNGGISQEFHSLVHTRSAVGTRQAEKYAGTLSGDKFKYNGTYIYRPYTEEVY